jgi:RNA polymerase sigma factor for flagellar operon FliA
MSAPQALIVDPERTFLDHLVVIDRVIAGIARRHALEQSDVDDLTSWVRTRIIDSDYAAFRKFAGKSTLPTYLGTVVTNLYRDYRNSVWGKWRPSAAASRLGPIAIRLERMVHRDGYTLREAIAVLESAGAGLSTHELNHLAAKLPHRVDTTEVSLKDTDSARVAASQSRDPLEREETDRAVEIVREVLADLPAEDQVLVRMRFWDDLSVADIARKLRIEQKPLYRRLESIQKTLGEALSARGIDQERALELLAGDSAWP